MTAVSYSWREPPSCPQRPRVRLLPRGDDSVVAHIPQFRGGLAGGVLSRVRAYIDQHIGERISLQDLARQAGVSRFHFARQFRHSTGESPMAYLRRVRIEHSLRMLLSDDTTIAEVAVRLGFADQSHFTRIFARLVGVSPGNFAGRSGVSATTSGARLSSRCETRRWGTLDDSVA